MSCKAPDAGQLLAARLHRSLQAPDNAGMNVLQLLPVFCTALLCQIASGAQAPRGIVALYDFAGESGSVVHDRSGSGLDLQIDDPASVKRSSGSLQVEATTRIRAKNSRKLVGRLKRSRELTIEAWVTPANLNQKGPARIVSLSKNPNERNFTLGQDGKRFDVRLRTTRNSKNGLPSIASLPGSLKTARTHVVYTRAKNGKVHIWLNGRHNFEGRADGDLSNWDASATLLLANEVTGDRPWLGKFHLLAIYDRALSSKEIVRNFKAGPTLSSSDQVAAIDPRATHFERHIAPLLSKHCLECHDASTHKGSLVLSHKASAFKGGESGLVIRPGKSGESLLWESVASDEMPRDREPLNADEKKLLREWIDSGAVWSLDFVDPAVYTHGGGGSQQFVRRLTVDEYVETVRVAVGVDIGKEARELLPRDLRADGFSNTAYNLNVDLPHVEAYSKLASIIVQRMDVSKFADGFGKRRNFTDPVMRPLIGRMGKWLLRGPLTDNEVTSLRGITTTVAASGGKVDEAIGYVVEAMLQSPRFIYRIENQPESGRTYADSYELASRLSYTLWGGPPDRELLAAAESGDLDADGCRQHAERMLKDPRAVRHSKRFVTEWLNLGRLQNLRPNKGRFPDWSPELATDMRSETLAFWEEVVWKQRKPLSSLMNAQVTFATPRLAEHYGLPRAGDDKDTLARYDLDTVPERGGLLTQGSVLTIGGDEGSTVTRGLFVMHELLRGVVKDPPPGVDTTPIPSKPGVTKRAIAMTRINDKSCGGCHSKFEPLSFGLENYDGLGSFRRMDEHGNKLQADGEILFPGEAKPISYRSSAELMKLLAESERVRESLTWKLTQFAVGRPLGAADARMVAQIHAEATKTAEPTRQR